MDDLIDREELLNNRPEYFNLKMEDEIKSARHKGWNDCNSYYYDLIIKQPKVNTEQYAHWELFSFGCFEDDTTAFICSNCKNTIEIDCEENIVPMQLGYRYCPYCGAKIIDDKEI